MTRLAIRAFRPVLLVFSGLFPLYVASTVFVSGDTALHFWLFALAGSASLFAIKHFAFSSLKDRQEGQRALKVCLLSTGFILSILVAGLFAADRASHAPTFLEFALRWGCAISLIAALEVLCWIEPLTRARSAGRA